MSHKRNLHGIWKVKVSQQALLSESQCRAPDLLQLFHVAVNLLVHLFDNIAARPRSPPDSTGSSTSVFPSLGASILTALWQRAPVILWVTCARLEEN